MSGKEAAGRTDVPAMGVSCEALLVEANGRFFVLLFEPSFLNPNENNVLIVPFGSLWEGSE